MREFDIVKSELGPGLSVIEASAGSGKTYALSHLVARLLLEGSVDSIGKILPVTFTNDAARELSDRIRKVLESLNAPASPDDSPAVGELRKKYAAAIQKGVIAKALLEIDQLRVSTIHSFCQRVLQTEGTLCGMPVMPELAVNTDEIIREILHDFWEKRMTDDALLSAAADADGWSFESDGALIKRLLPNHNATPVPSIANNWSELNQRAALFDHSVCKEALEIVTSVTKWNKDGNPTETAIEEKLRLLENAKTLDAANVLNAIATVAKLPEFIYGRGRESSLLKNRAKECQAVCLANEILAEIQLLHWSFLVTCLRHTHAAVEAYHRKNRLISYDGLIEFIHHALVKGLNKDRLTKRLQERFSVALIDESQDTDPRQFEIFSSIFLGVNTHRLVLVGDPKQAIYGFRGADVNTYLNAKELAGDRIFGLTKTFRAPQRLVDAWNALFGGENAFLKEGLQYEKARSGMDNDVTLRVGKKEKQARMDVWISSENANYKQCENEAVTAAADEIVRLLNDGEITTRDNAGRELKSERIKPNHFAVLTSTGAQAKLVEKALKARNIPSVRAGDDDVMGSEEASDLLMILRALEEPRRRSLRFAALATRTLGRNDAQLQILATSEEAMLPEFLRWQELLLQAGPAVAIAQMDRDEGIAGRLAKGNDGARRVTNFRQLCDLLQWTQAEHGNRVGRLVRWLTDEIARAQDRSEIEERQIRLESDDAAVQIVTMHKAKGLEYDLVFCPFLWHLPKLRKEPQKLSRGPADDLLIDVGLDESHESDLIQAALEERLRLAYVAVTRAKVHVWIHSKNSEDANPRESALNWLLSRTATDVVSKEGGAIAFGPPPQSDATPWHPAEMHAEKLSAEQAPTIPQPWRLTSFSALVREANPYGGADATENNEMFEAKKASPDMQPNLFLNAVAGKTVGDALHHWMQNWNFQKPDESALKRLLSSYTFPKTSESNPPPHPFEEATLDMLENLRSAILPGFECVVAKACPDPQMSEWHFYLPIRNDAPLDAWKIAKIFQRHPQKGFEGYHESLQELNANQLRGFLNGFIDRIAIHPETRQCGIIDWKTNRLGSSIESYATDSLRRNAMHSHYFLQVHLYLTALRRHLNGTIPPRDAWLVYLRGVSAKTNHGILHIQPPEKLLEELDELFFKP